MYFWPDKSKGRGHNSVMIYRIDNISFNGYKSILKQEWLKGNMPEVKKGIYGGLLTKDTISLEHLRPVSKGGKTDLFNLALADRQLNTLRGNKPLKFFLDKDKFVEYLEQFEKTNLPNFNGKQYIKGLIKTIIQVLETER